MSIYVYIYEYECGRIRARDVIVNSRKTFVAKSPGGFCCYILRLTLPNAINYSTVYSSLLVVLLLCQYPQYIWLLLPVAYIV